MTSLLLVIVTCIVMTSSAPELRELRMTGSTSSFAQYETWRACQNGSIALQFATDQSDALILYSDAFGREYVELRLIDATLRMRVSLGDGDVIITAGSQLNDSRLHSVEIRRRRDVTQLTLDRIPQTKRHSGDLDFGRDDFNGFVFVGGLPLAHRSHWQRLAMPVIIFINNFRGIIRNIRFSQCGQPTAPPTLVDFGGLQADDVTSFICDSDADPCVNEGRCVPVDDENTLCSCDRKRFTGRRCEKGEFISTPFDPLPPFHFLLDAHR